MKADIIIDTSLLDGVHCLSPTGKLGLPGAIVSVSCFSLVAGQSGCCDVCCDDDA